MFKFQLNVNGVAYNDYCQNKNSDSVTKYLMKYYTRVTGELITKEDIEVFMFDDAYIDLFEGRLKQSKYNQQAHEAHGNLCIKRIVKAMYKAGDKVKLTDYEAEVVKLKDKFKDAKEKDKLKEKAPKFKKEDVLDENGDPVLDVDGKKVQVDTVTVEAGDTLEMDQESIEMELVGTPLSRWSYDSNGKFIGNK